MSLKAVELLYLGCWWLWCLVSGVGAFNIDIANPIVLRRSSQRTADRPSAYFGFSLDFYQSRNDSVPW